MTVPVAIVTGGARGIGHAIAIALAGTGFDIAIVDRLAEHEARLALEGVNAAGRVARFYQHDLGLADKACALVDQIVSDFGRIDCLVNNAGVQSPVRGDVLDVDPAHFDVVIDTNLRGTFFLTQGVARWMAANEDSSVYRAMLFISSTNAVIPAPTRAAYCVSKAGLAMLSSIFALRMAAHGVHVFEIRPGTIRTDMTRDVIAEREAGLVNGAVPISRIGEPADIGRAAATLASGGIPFATGAAVFVDGGGNLRPN